MTRIRLTFHSMKVFCETGNGGRSNKTWSPSQVWRPSGVVCLKDAVFVKDMHCIQEFDRDGNFRRSFGQDDLHEPYGLVANKYGHLITIDIDEGKKPHLCIFDEIGSLLHRRPLKALTDPKLVVELGVDVRRSACRFIGVYADLVYVVDLRLNNVFVCDFDGGGLFYSHHS